MFDELLLIEIKCTITKLLEKIMVSLRKSDIHDFQTNTIGRRMVENDIRLVELKAVSEQSLSDK